MLHKLLLRYNLSFLLLIVFFTPGLLALIYSVRGYIPTPLLPDYNLAGVTTTSTPVKLTLHNLTNHKYQKYVEDYLTLHLPLRSFFIRTNNQFYYSLFKKSYSSDGQLIVGKSHQLFTDHYILAYCNLSETSHHSHPELIAWANKIKLLSDYFVKNGQMFLYLITPSKAGYIPEKIPSRFHCQQKGSPLYLQEMIKLLEERNIPYINGQAAMEDATKQYHIPMFPRGGIHWNEVGATFTANKIIKKINESKQNLLELINYKYELNHQPFGHDRDLLDLLNLIHPNTSYLVPKLEFHPSGTPKLLKLVFVGGSFCERLIDIFLSNQTFSKITFYSYFKLGKFDYAMNRNVIRTDVDLNSPDLLDPIQNADVVILEENAELTVSNHGGLFFEKMQPHLQTKN